MVVFGPEDAAHTITVFTDIDCTYCRKLHREIDQINARNIRVRYVFYPRFGPGSESWAKADAVWCSKDRQSALTRAKSGEDITADNCPTPVAEHYALGNKIGVRGTPAILMEDGELLPGYVPAAELAAYLDRT
jgi:thiol:disulfide interchange protein DsbC